MSNVNRLVGTIAGKFSGPILVVGGAPSVPAELEWLRERGFDTDKCTIISANEHAKYAGLSPHFVVVNDDVHTELGVHQEPRMRELLPDAKLLSRHWWADYRTAMLPPCNSGLKALMFAAILGGNPIIAIGFDHYRGEKLYFHEVGFSTAGNRNAGREESHFAQQVKAVRDVIGEVPVRTVFGPLCATWPVWSPDERFEPRADGRLEIDAVHEAAYQRYVCLRGEAPTFDKSMVPDGAVFAVTQIELSALLLSGAGVDATEWDLAAVQAPQRACLDERIRHLSLIAKLRAHPRAVRRGFYDSDLVRLIKWAEDGQEPRAIAKRTGLPLEQITFLLDTMGLTPR